MISFHDYFDRVCVINLPASVTRRERTASRLRETGLAETVHWHAATNGHALHPPHWWNAGHGAWGCLLSHSRVVEDALRDGVERLLILEDDVIFHRDAGRMLETFMDQVPDDWDQLFLGGQHLSQPVPVAGAPFVVRGTSITRAHAYAVHGRCLSRFHQHIWQSKDYLEGACNWHFDTQFSQAHRLGKWQTYAPLWWLAGQDEGFSEQLRQQNPAYWWHAPQHALSLPFVALPKASPSAAKRSHLHLGDPKTLKATGLKPGPLYNWLMEMAQAALSKNQLPTWDPAHAPAELIRQFWPPGIIDASNPDSLRGLQYYPWQGSTSS
jgi:GR25 family glycosyltransferase involved in LPS biosynthesis